MEVRFELDHEDGVIRAQSWLRGRVIVEDTLPAPGADSLMTTSSKSATMGREARIRENSLNSHSGKMGTTVSTDLAATSSGSMSAIDHDLVVVELLGKEIVFGTESTPKKGSAKGGASCCGGAAEAIVRPGTTGTLERMFWGERIQVDESTEKNPPPTRNSSSFSSSSNESLSDEAKDDPASNTSSDMSQNRRRRKFSFALYLPGSLPPSMHFQKEGAGCSVQYTLAAHVGNMVRQTRILRVVGPTLSSKIYPEILPPNCVPVVSGKKSRSQPGFLVVGAKVENSHIGKGHYLTLSISLRNKSCLDVDQVDVRLLENIQWKHLSVSNSGSLAGSEKNETLVLDMYRNLVPSGLIKHMEGCTEITASAHDLSQTVVVDDLILNEMTQELNSIRNTVQLAVPTTARDSYQGTWIQVTHLLEIKFLTQGRLECPTLCIPLKIFDPPMETTTRSSFSSPHYSSGPNYNKVLGVAVTHWPDLPVSGGSKLRRDSSGQSSTTSSTLPTLIDDD